jgi:hypothetical protein
MKPKTALWTISPRVLLTRRWGLSQCQDGEGMLTDARTRTSRLEGPSLTPVRGPKAQRCLLPEENLRVPQ